MTEHVVLSDSDVEQLITFEDTMRLMEQAFADYLEGKSYVFP